MSFISYMPTIFGDVKSEPWFEKTLGYAMAYDGLMLAHRFPSVREQLDDTLDLLLNPNASGELHALTEKERESVSDFVFMLFYRFHCYEVGVMNVRAVARALVAMCGREDEEAVERAMRSLGVIYGPVLTQPEIEENHATHAEAVLSE